jgi:hypothetical protein
MSTCNCESLSARRFGVECSVRGNNIEHELDDSWGYQGYALRGLYHVNRYKKVLQPNYLAADLICYEPSLRVALLSWVEIMRRACMSSVRSVAKTITVWVGTGSWNNRTRYRGLGFKSVREGTRRPLMSRDGRRLLRSAASETLPHLRWQSQTRTSMKSILLS